MIFDRIENRKLYSNTSGLEKGFEFIEEYLKNPCAPGRYEIDGDKVYAMVQEYETKEPSSFEAHQRYIDIQFVASGKELIKYANTASLTVTEAFDAEKDYMLFDGKKEAAQLILEPGMFAVFFPADGHMPGCISGRKTKVVKIVVKVAVQ